MKKLYVSMVLLPCFLTLYSQATVETDYMLLGRETLPLNGQFINDTFVMIDYTKGSLRGGILKNAHFWSPDSVKAGSFGFGVNVLATGNGGTTALGINTWANGNNGATALGTLTRAFGNDGATALGVNSWAYGNNGATALGCFTKATGNNGATTLGFVTLASGSNGATALGSNTIASGYNGATALGAGTKAYGNNGATALGYHTFATGNSCTAMGVFSDSIVTSGTEVTATSPLVIVGNGDLGNPSNALVIRKMAS
ncbi:MAG: hypothetical protein IPL46_21870 [Saprospiraceae bacterium]|nr:hypothetical protein [Saprospiraceae bacterium]